MQKVGISGKKVENTRLETNLKWNQIERNSLFFCMFVCLL